MRARRLAFSLLLLITLAAAAEERRSGNEFMGPALRAMQADDSANPAMLAVLDGEAEWSDRNVTSGKSCADCHGPVTSLRDVALRYPAFDGKSGKPISLGRRIALCRAAQQGGAADWAPESPPLLAMEIYLGRQSRGEKLRAVSDPRLQPFLAEGECLYRQRAGQLDLSCADCHDDHWGQSLGGATIPQAHPTGYPIYRLEWQAVGSLQRRLRNCLAGMRALVPAYESEPLLALSLYLRQRAAGMTSETPAVRP
jgi:sulfur-oxidizing protein SoxA